MIPLGSDIVLYSVPENIVTTNGAPIEEVLFPQVFPEGGYEIIQPSNTDIYNRAMALQAEKCREQGIRWEVLTGPKPECFPRARLTYRLFEGEQRSYTIQLFVVRLKDPSKERGVVVPSIPYRSPDVPKLSIKQETLVLSQKQRAAIPVLEWLYDESDDSRRQGRTIAIAIALLRLAARHPGKKFFIGDHVQTSLTSRLMRDNLHALADRLGLGPYLKTNRTSLWFEQSAECPPFKHALRASALMNLV